MYSLSLVLQVPVSFFYEDIEDMETAQETAKNATALIGLMKSPDAVKLGMAFGKIEDPHVRSHIFKLTRAIAQQAA